MRHLLDTYPVLLLDAYGVLVSGDEVLAGASELISYLEQHQHPYWVLTNDGSRLPETMATRLHRLGLPIAAHRIITSLSLITPYFTQHNLRGSRCVVLGTEDSRKAVCDAGGVVVEAQERSSVDLVAICDERGYPFVDTLNAVVSLMFRAIDQLGTPPRLVQPNPDYLYPTSGGGFGFTAGAITQLLETAVTRRYPDLGGMQIDQLGKPYHAIFEEVLQRSQTMHMVMIGDQLDTDIQGANEFGIDAALVTSGLHHPGQLGSPSAITPTYQLASLWP